MEDPLVVLGAAKQSLTLRDEEDPYYQTQFQRKKSISSLSSAPVEVFLTDSKEKKITGPPLKTFLSASNQL